MIARLESPLNSPRVAPRLRFGTIVLCAIAMTFIGVRLYESPENPATAFRVIMSLCAVAFVLFARHKSMLQRATIFIALEAVGGCVAFAYVDVPFIVGHQAQIGQVAVAIYDGVHRTR